MSNLHGIVSNLHMAWSMFTRGKVVLRDGPFLVKYCGSFLVFSGAMAYADVIALFPPFKPHTTVRLLLRNFESRMYKNLYDLRLCQFKAILYYSQLFYPS